MTDSIQKADTNKAIVQERCTEAACLAAEISYCQIARREDGAKGGFRRRAILAWVAKAKFTSIGVVAILLDVDYSIASRLISGLVKRGYLDEVPVLHPKLRKIFVPTRTGFREGLDLAGCVPSRIRSRRKINFLQIPHDLFCQCVMADQLRFLLLENEDSIVRYAFSNELYGMNWRIPDGLIQYDGEGDYGYYTRTDAIEIEKSAKTANEARATAEALRDLVCPEYITYDGQVGRIQGAGGVDSVEVYVRSPALLQRYQYYLGDPDFIDEGLFVHKEAFEVAPMADIDLEEARRLLAMMRSL